MHLLAVKRQLVARCRYRRQLPLVIVELFAVYCLPLWVTVMMPPGRGAWRRQCCMHRLLNH